MKIKNHKICFFTYFLTLIFANSISFAGVDNMPHMPTIQPKKTTVIDTRETGETLLEQRGYGDKEPEVRMMNLMMVEGSGYEGMDMGAMKMGNAKTQPNGKVKPMNGMAMEGQKMGDLKLDLKSSPNPAQVGPNLYEFSFTDKEGQIKKGLKLTSKVYMTSMDMGTDTPPVKELTPGVYRVKAIFSMQGPWAVEILGASSPQKLEVNVSK